MNYLKVLEISDQFIFLAAQSDNIKSVKKVKKNIDKSKIITQADKMKLIFLSRNQIILFRRFLMYWIQIRPQNYSIMSGFWDILI